MQKVAHVYVEKAVYAIDTPYSYRIPHGLDAEVLPGCRVLVPFGGGNKKVQGFVASVTEEPDEISLKPVAALIDKTPLFTQEMTDMVSFLVTHTFCTFYEAVRTILPIGTNVTVEQVYRCAHCMTDEEISAYPPKQQRILQFLTTSKSEKELRSFLNTKQAAHKNAAVRTLLDKNVIVCEENASRKVAVPTERRVAVCETFNAQAASLSKKQAELYTLLRTVGEAAPKEICYLCGVTEAVLRALVQKGAAYYYEKECAPSFLPSPKAACPTREIVLSEEQQAAADGIYALIREPKPNAALLQGVTGSGKTQVYLKLIAQTLADGKNAMMLVPEISLTPQMVEQFTMQFGEIVAVIHSGLTPAQRLYEFERIRHGAVRIVVGTRSAVFSPLSDIALIIMDEEAQASYKSDASPRYHARDVAKWRCGRHHATLLLGSATPSVDSRYQAQRGRYAYFVLKNRYANAILPEVFLIDMRAEPPEASLSLLSGTLVSELLKNKQAGEQSILLLNRRGYQAYATCMACGKVLTCPSCDVALTYHRANERLMCHYCGHSEPVTARCPVCGGMLKRTGAGTQRIEEELNRLIPGIRVLRMDTDTTYSRYAYERRFDAFRRGEYDVIIGTQMIAKGLDFKNVTLAAVLNGDSGLGSGDFRSTERVFSLITQVIGRSGRSEKAGRAYIQTFSPDHWVIQYAAAQDYDAFYREEIALRKTLMYPPFCDLVTIGIAAADETVVKRATLFALSKLKEEANNTQGIALKVIGAAPAAVARVSGKYRYRIVMKCRMNAPFRTMLSAVLRHCQKSRECSNVTMFADVNGEIL